MKRLYIVRHSKSGDKQSGMKDIHRNLNQRGKKDAVEMGARLAKQNVSPDAFIASPAERAQQTAKRMIEGLGLSGAKIITEDTLYHGSSNDILSFVRGMNDKFNRVMIFGHNPDFSWLADRLAETSFDNLPTSAVVCLDFQAKSWKDVKDNSGAVVFYEHPKK